ncbi:MAG: hypothetical protein AAB381_00385 [Patescibacteria group bacterium]
MDLIYLLCSIFVACAFGAFATWRGNKEKNRRARLFIGRYLDERHEVSAQELHFRLNEEGLTFSVRAFEVFMGQLVAEGLISYENQPGGARLYRLPSGNSMREMV